MKTKQNEWSPTVLIDRVESWVGESTRVILKYRVYLKNAKKVAVVFVVIVAVGVGVDPRVDVMTKH